MDIRGVLSGLSKEVVSSIRQAGRNVVDDHVLEETDKGIRLAIMSMLEVGVEENKIIEMLQKYWDLRRSEAESFILEAKDFAE